MSVRLIIAAANNRVDEVYHRLRAGENVNFRENLFGETALHKATFCKHGEMMDLLLSFGANPNIYRKCYPVIVFTHLLPYAFLSSLRSIV